MIVWMDGVPRELSSVDAARYQVGLVPENLLGISRAAKAEEIRAFEAQKYSEGFLYNGKRFKIEQKHVAEFQWLYDKAIAALSNPSVWTGILTVMEWEAVGAVEYEIVNTPELAKDFCEAAEAFRVQCYMQSRTHQKVVWALADLNAVRNYDYSAGWPE